MAESEIEGYVEALGDKLAKAREGAVRALADIGKPAVPALIGALKDPKLKLWAAYSLAKIGPDAKPAVPALIKMLEDKQGVMCSNIAKALGEIGDGSAMPALAEMLLKDERQVVRESAAQALVKIGHPSAVSVLTKVISRGTMYYGISSYTLFESLRSISEDKIPFLTKVLKEKKLPRELRQVAAKVLDNYGGVFSDPSLVREMKNLYWKPVMKRAMEAISKANFDMEAIITSALSEVKNSTDWRACSNAARTVREALVRNIIDALKKLSCKDRESAFAQLRDPGHFVGQTYEPYTLERCAEIVVNKVITDDRRYFLLVSEDEVVLERITSFENSGTMIFRTGPDEYYTHIWHEDLD